jgi:membrane associated rhomboid family serine protease
MIPVGDVIPTRTRPVLTLTVLGAMGAALAWPAVRAWWLPWAASAVLIWLAGGTIEDRFGHGRFAVFMTLCGGVAAASQSAVGPGPAAVWIAAGAAAGVAAAYLVLFPRSRVQVLVPVVVGLEVSEVPVWVAVGLWAAVQIVAGWAAPADVQMAGAGGVAVSVLASGAVGALGGLVLPRNERMRVEWWD